MPLRGPRTTATGEDANTGGGTFPEGVWTGQIVDTYDERTPPDFYYKGDNPQCIAGAKVRSIALGNAQAVQPNQSNPGNQRMFVEFILEDNGVNVTDVDVTGETNNGHGWGIVRSARQLLNLAHSLGATYPEGDEVVVADNFVDMHMPGS